MPIGIQGSLVETKFWKTWRNMIQRCTNKNHPSYMYYGGRGITVSREWLNFDNFEIDMIEEYAYHLEDHPGRQTTLDRIDNSKGYSKENCRWATVKEQNNNRRKRPKTPRNILLERGRLKMKHGLISSYYVYGCKCDICKKVAKIYAQKKYLINKKKGYYENKKNKRNRPQN